MDKKLNSEALKNVLWETIEALKTRKISVKEANAIGYQSREITRIVRIEMDLARLTGQKVKNNKFLTNGKKGVPNE